MNKDGPQMREQREHAPACNDLPPLPAKDADHATWYAYHEALHKAGKLTPPKPAE